MPNVMKLRLYMGHSLLIEPIENLNGDETFRFYCLSGANILRRILHRIYFLIYAMLSFLIVSISSDQRSWPEVLQGLSGPYKLYLIVSYFPRLEVD